MTTYVKSLILAFAASCAEWMPVFVFGCLPLVFDALTRPAPEVGQAWVPQALMAAMSIGKVLSGGAKGAEKSRMTEAELNLSRDQLRNSQYQTGQQAQMQLANTDLARKGFSEQARGNRAKQAGIADMLANFKPTSINVPGVQTAEVSGGLQMGEGSKAAMMNLYKEALMKQLEGDTFEGAQILKAPAITPTPKAGKMESIGGLLGTIGSIAGAFLPQQEDQGYGFVPRPGGR